MALDFEVWGAHERACFARLLRDHRYLIEMLVTRSGAALFTSCPFKNVEAAEYVSTFEELELYFANEVDPENQFALQCKFGRHARATDIKHSLQIALALYDATMGYCLPQPQRGAYWNTAASPRAPGQRRLKDLAAREKPPSETAHGTRLNHDAVTLTHGVNGLMFVDEDAGLAGSATLILHAPIISVADAAGAADQQFCLLLCRPCRCLLLGANAPPSTIPPPPSHVGDSTFGDEDGRASRRGSRPQRQRVCSRSSASIRPIRYSIWRASTARRGQPRRHGFQAHPILTLELQGGHPDHQFGTQAHLLGLQGINQRSLLGDHAAAAYLRLAVLGHQHGQL